MPAKNTASLVKSQDSNACKNFKWFSDNQVKGNGDKCQVLLTSEDSVVEKVDSAQITKSF